MGRYDVTSIATPSRAYLLYLHLHSKAQIPRLRADRKLNHVKLRDMRPYGREMCVVKRETSSPQLWDAMVGFGLIDWL